MGGNGVEMGRQWKGKGKALGGSGKQGEGSGRQWEAMGRGRARHCRQMEGSSGWPSKKQCHPWITSPTHHPALTTPQQPGPRPAPNPLPMPPFPAAHHPTALAPTHSKPPGPRWPPAAAAGWLPTAPWGHANAGASALQKMSAHGHHPVVPLPPPAAHPVPGHPCGSSHGRALTRAGCHRRRSQWHVLIRAVVLIGGCGAGRGGERWGRGKLQVSVDHALGHALCCTDGPDGSCSATVAPFSRGCKGEVQLVSAEAEVCCEVQQTGAGKHSHNDWCPAIGPGAAMLSPSTPRNCSGSPGMVARQCS